MTVLAWPSGSGNTGQAPEPSAMMEPGRVLDWPNGTQVGGNAATDLLAQAVGWWDASYYRDGDRFLRNRGTGRELLDLRLGSSFEANSNDPLFLAPEDTGYVYLSGVTGNALSVPDEAALDITGDIDIRVRVAFDGYFVSGGDRTFVSKGQSFSGDASYWCRINSNGTLYFAWTTDGSTAITRSSNDAVTTQDGSPIWFRSTLDVDNGASGHDVAFYTSNDGLNWTQLGTTITTAGTTSIYSSSTDFRFGRSSLSTRTPTGKFYRCQVLDGIDGTTVLDIDCDAITSGSATSFTAVTNQTVTVNRSTSGRKSVAMPSRWNGGRACFLFGTDDYMEVQDTWQHQMLNFGQGDSLTVLAAYRAPSFTANQQVLSKGATGAGYNLRSGVGTPANGIGSAGADPFVLRSAGLSVHAVVRTPARVTAVVNSLGASTDTYPPVNLSNADSFRIGRSSGTVYQDMEFLAAAVFRRALTADEIALITRHYTGA